MNRTFDVKRLVLAALFLALCMVLPFLTGNIPEIGSKLSPMHLPVLLCGFVCGWPYGLLVGLIAPPLRFLLVGMPPIFPTGLAMALELAAYGALCGLLYQKLPKKPLYVYVTLVIAMLLGRVVWGAASYAFMALSGKTFTFALFLAGAFVNAVPAIILQLVLVPLVVFALQRAKVMQNA